jgi:hypothetical protein
VVNISGIVAAQPNTRRKQVELEQKGIDQAWYGFRAYEAP